MAWCNSSGTPSWKLPPPSSPSTLLLLLQVPKPARKHSPAKRAIVDPHEVVALFAEDEIVLRVDLRDDPAVGELMRLRVARQVEIHELVEIRAAGHVGITARGSRIAAPGWL